MEIPLLPSITKSSAASIIILLAGFCITLISADNACTNPLPAKIPNIKCYVCSNSKGKEKNNPFYKANCLNIDKMSAADKKNITIDCNNDYDKYFLEKLGRFSTTNNSKSVPSVDKRCACGVYSHCKSMYYYQKNPIKVKLSGKNEKDEYTDEVGPFEGDTERVFRMCGCDDIDQKQAKPLKQKSECNDITLGTNRRRYCKCKNGDGKPCNSALRGVHSSSALILLLTFFGLSTKLISSSM